LSPVIYTEVSHEILKYHCLYYSARLLQQEIIKKKYGKLLSTVWSLYILTDVTKNAMGKYKNALWRSKYKGRYIIVEKYTIEKQNNTAPKFIFKRILKHNKQVQSSISTKIFL
jgi:hypothetical protein